MSTLKYEYEELDPARSEIRVLKFIDSVNDKDSDLVHCSLTKVSLDDVLPQYEDFLLECRPPNPSHAKRWWLEIDRSASPWLKVDAYRPRIAAWRYFVDMNRPKNRIQILNRNATELPHPPCPTPVLRTVASDVSLDASSNAQEVITDDEVSIPPRFSWGDFEALSYCWESDVRNKIVVIDNFTVNIPTNLEAMLQKLRHLPEARSGMGFWVDGLCINQDKLSEKNHQVQLMKHIYESALSVVVWLGPGERSSDLAMDFILQLCDIYGDLRHNVLDHKEIVSWFDRKETAKAPWSELLALLSRNYFRRMWIIQELAMNTDMTLFVCGDRQIPREAIENASNLCMTYALDIMEALISSRHSPPSRDIYRNVVWRESYKINTLLALRSEAALESFLDLARKSDVTDPKDKVYGLLGLLPGSIAAAIIPDYAEAKSKQQVYIELAKAMLEHCDRLDEVLSWCAFSEEPTWPSWVPDWETPLERYHIRWFRCRDAGANNRPDWSLSNDESQLQCKGLLIDRVEQLSVPPAQLLPYRTVAPQAKSSSVEGQNGRYGDKSGLQAALFRTMLHAHKLASIDGDLTQVYWVNWDQLTEPDPWDIAMENFWTFGMKALTRAEDAVASDPWQLFDRFRQSNAHFTIFGHTFINFFPGMRSYHVHSISKYRHPGAPVEWKHTPYELTQEHNRNIRLASIALDGRRLITTETGFLGLAPDETQTGDTVAVLYGCNYPVILRRCQSGFRYIGECYIDGLMDGEAVEAESRGEYQQETVVLV